MISDFFQLGPIPHDAMTGYYNAKVVLLSYIVAVLASLVALEISQGIRQAKGSIFWLLIGGAFAMGAGIFSMHFIGMLAFIMPMPMAYDFSWTLLSLIIAIVASGFAYYLVRHPTNQIRYKQIILGGFILGIAIASMHYTGMTGMLGVNIRYLPDLFLLSLLVAVGASIAALYLMIECEKGSLLRQRTLKTGSILIMGAAICGMHYIGMEAAVMTHSSTAILDATHISALSTEKLSFLIGFIASLIMIVALLLTGYRHLIVVKMLIGFLITPFLLIPLMVILLQKIEDSRQWGNVISNQLIPQIISLSEMENNILKLNDYIPSSNFYYTETEWFSNKKQAQNTLNEIEKSEKKYIEQQKTYLKPNILDVKNLKALRDKISVSLLSLLDVIEKQASIETIVEKRAELDRIQNELSKLVQNSIAEEFSELKRWNEVNKPPANESEFIFFATGLIFLFSAITGLVIAMSITSSLKKAVQIIKKLTLGDLNFKIENFSNNETGQLLDAMNTLALSNKKMSDALMSISKGDLSISVEPRSDKDSLGLALVNMIDNLRDINSEIQNEVSSLTNSSQDIVHSVSEVAERSAETSVAIKETKFSAEELKQIAHITDEKAKDVLNNSKETLQIVSRSENLLKDTIVDMMQISEKMRIISEGMGKLSEHSQTIREIIDTVNDLAEQSNLLAVNAAIEAAIAGEHGKSFTIVAKEIKALAEQSKTATFQVRSILNEIQNSTSMVVLATEQGAKAVEKGVLQSAQTNNSMQLLSKSVVQVTQAANQIAISSQQQFIGVGQVTAAMNNINEATLQLVDHMKRIESASVNLKSIGTNLKAMTDHYIMPHEEKTTSSSLNG